MLLYFRLGIVYVHQRRFGKHFGSCCRILNQQVRHYAHGSHFVKTASHEVQQFLIAAFLNGIGAGFELIRHFFYAVQQRLHFFAARNQLIVAQGGGIRTVGDVADGGYRLQLCSTFVDAGDTCIAINALTGIFQHEAGTAVNLDTVVSILVGVFGVHTFCQRCEGIGQFGIFLLFLTFFRSQFAFAGDVVQCLVDVYVA